MGEGIAELKEAWAIPVLSPTVIFLNYLGR